MGIFCRKEWVEKMIPITKQKEPQSFDSDVRIPGMRYLQINPKPTSREFSKHDYWRKINPDLYRLYNGICAYTGMWFADTSASVDHFFPKSKNPELAYEWSNYRLTTQRMNSTKSDEINLIDPFDVEFGWFILDLNTFLIKPNETLGEAERDKITQTILVLRLNYDDDRVEYRREIIQGYVDGVYDFDFLKEKYPYIAYEIGRQRQLKE
jgi:uncharacterized protein (TIGR02646 family)